MNYSDMSDFEINKLVAEDHGIDTSEWSYIETDGITTLMIPVNSGYKNYCNSWADMGPIIESEKLTVWAADSADKDGLWNACWPGLLTPRVEWQPNPLRSAAICYLMMKESEG